MALAERLEVNLFDLFVSPDASPREKLVDLTRSMPAGTIRRLIRDATRA